MTNWVFYKNSNPNQYDIDKSISTLVNVYPDLKENWDKYIKESYTDYKKEKIDYVDIGVVSRFIIDRIKIGNTDDFNAFFNKVELILNNSDVEVENFIVVGLLEGIMNNADGEEFNYYTGFDKWLGPKSKEYWNNLIIFWEGPDAKSNFIRNNPGKEDCLILD